MFSRTETILHPVSLKERVIAVETIAEEALDFDAARDSPSLVQFKEIDGRPVRVVLEYPWHHDFTQTVRVEYERTA